MEFPSELVRQAAIDCLIEIPLDEWEYDEAVYMVDNIKQLKMQLKEGNNERIIASLFFILSKFVDNPNLPLTKDYFKKLA